MSVPYYTRLERGDLAGASDSVLEALARALQLDDAERAYLFDLARAAQPIGLPPRRRPTKHRIRPSVQQLLDAISGAAAHIGNDRLDIIAANPLGRALFLEMFDGQEKNPNAARFVFLDPRARDFYLDWDRIARDVVATLRSAAGRNPYDRDLTTSSANYQPAATSYASTGQSTTSASTSAASSSSTTARSATSSSTTNAWKSSSTRA